MNTIKITPHGSGGLGNILKSFITALSIFPNTKIEDNLCEMCGEYSSILDDCFILTEDEKKCYNEAFFTWRFLILKSEEKNQKNLINEFPHNNYLCGNNMLDQYFSDKITIDLFYNRQLICDQVFNRIINTIEKIKFKPIIYEEINKYQIKSNSLGISVRTWKAIHENNIHRHYNFDDYIHLIKNVLNKNTNIDTVFLSVDNLAEYDKYISVLKEYTNIKLITYHNNNLNILQNSIIKVLLLSKCKYLICSRISTFSELVFWFSKCEQLVFPLF